MEQEEIEKLQEENAKLTVENQQLKNDKEKAEFKAGTYQKQVKEYADTLNNLTLQKEPEIDPEEQIKKSLNKIYNGKLTNYEFVAEINKLNDAYEKYTEGDPTAKPLFSKNFKSMTKEIVNEVKNAGAEKNKKVSNAIINNHLIGIQN